MHDLLSSYGCFDVARYVTSKENPADASSRGIPITFPRIPILAICNISSKTSTTSLFLESSSLRLAETALSPSRCQNVASDIPLSSQIGPAPTSPTNGSSLAVFPNNPGTSRPTVRSTSRRSLHPFVPHCLACDRRPLWKPVLRQTLLSLIVETWVLQNAIYCVHLMWLVPGLIPLAKHTVLVFWYTMFTVTREKSQKLFEPQCLSPSLPPLLPV